MSRAPRHALVWAIGALVATDGFVGCGSRTALDVPAGGDAGAEDEGGHGSVPFDATSGGDSRAAPDGRERCSDAGLQKLGYLLDDTGVLSRYDARSGATTALGTPDCGNGNVQWTMTANEDVVLIVYTDWSLYQVDPSTLACTRTSFDFGALGVEADFGVALSGSGEGSELYVYGIANGTNAPALEVSRFGDTFAWTTVGAVTPLPAMPDEPVNLTADPDGRLWAYAPSGALLEIDPHTARVLQSIESGVPSDSTWATLAYGEDIVLVAGSRAADYDVTRGLVLSSHDLGVSPVGGGAFVDCLVR